MRATDGVTDSARFRAIEGVRGAAPATGRVSFVTAGSGL
jgi:hypothetical protein